MHYLPMYFICCDAVGTGLNYNEAVNKGGIRNLLGLNIDHLMQI